MLTPGSPATEISQGTLPDMVATPRTRVSFFMKNSNGFIEHNGERKIDGSLLSAVMRGSVPIPKFANPCSYL